MKIMAFNIYRGGVDGEVSRIPHIKEVINEAAPDFLAIQEANNFEKEDFARLNEIKKECGLEYATLAEGLLKRNGRSFHVASFSKYPYKTIEKFEKGVWINAGIKAVIETELGDIEILNTHLTANGETDRLRELSMALKGTSKYEHKIILGDLNSLSFGDGYGSEIAKGFNDGQRQKFLDEGGRVQYEVMRLLGEAGYIDCAVEWGINKISTVPTESNKDAEHETPLRLDYILVSKTLAPKIKDMKVIKTGSSEKASDHYPLLLTLG